MPSWRHIHPSTHASVHTWSRPSGHCAWHPTQSDQILSSSASQSRKRTSNASIWISMCYSLKSKLYSNALCTCTIMHCQLNPHSKCIKIKYKAIILRSREHCARSTQSPSLFSSLPSGHTHPSSQTRGHSWLRAVGHLAGHPALQSDQIISRAAHSKRNWWWM